MRFAHSLIALCFAATPALAELNANQQVAYDNALPPIEKALADLGPGMDKLAPVLTECVVINAKRREVAQLAENAETEASTDLLNEIMNRPKVQACMVKGVAN